MKLPAAPQGGISAMVQADKSAMIPADKSAMVQADKSAALRKAAEYSSKDEQKANIGLDSGSREGTAHESLSPGNGTR